jgi:hypothetical protein
MSSIYFSNFHYVILACINLKFRMRCSSPSSVLHVTFMLDRSHIRWTDPDEEWNCEADITRFSFAFLQALSRAQKLRQFVIWSDSKEEMVVSKHSS